MTILNPGERTTSHVAEAMDGLLQGGEGPVKWRKQEK